MNILFLQSKKLNDFILLPAKFCGNILVNIGNLQKVTLRNKIFIIISDKLGFYIREYTYMSNFMELYC